MLLPLRNDTVPMKIMFACRSRIERITPRRSHISVEWGHPRYVAAYLPVVSVRLCHRDFQAERELQRFGKMLLQHLPSETTKLLIDLCCGSLDAPQAPTVESPIAEQAHQSLSTANPTSSADHRSSDATSQSSHRQPGLHQAESSPPSKSNSRDTEQQSSPSPKQFMAHFATQEAEYIRFLREVLDRRFSNDQEQASQETDYQTEKKALHNALLEVYLSQADTSPANASQLRADALELLRSGQIDINQAVLVCINSHFDAGIVLLYEQLGRIEDLFRYRMRSGAPSTVIGMLWTYGDQYPRLFSMALRWLTADSSLLSSHLTEAERIIDEIGKRGLMKPVEIVHLLSRNPHASIGLAKPYLKSTFQTDATEIQSNQALVDSYQEEISRKHRAFESLVDEKNPQIFQASRCSSCGGSLENPSIQCVVRFSKRTV